VWYLTTCVLQKQFVDDLKRALGGHHGASRQLVEGAAVTCVKLCKAATYINISDCTNVLFVLVQSVVQDLKVRTSLTPNIFNPNICENHNTGFFLFGIFKALLFAFAYAYKSLKLLNLSRCILQCLLFNPVKPFSRGQGWVSQDVDLMIDCFLSCFRITPHNNDLLKTCLSPSAQPIYHFVLVNALHRIVTQVRYWLNLSCYELRMITGSQFIAIDY
jgi:neurofibromin 1